MTAPDDEPRNDRLTELEIKAAFLEDLLDEVNRTVFRQQQQIEMLQQEIRALRQQVQAAAPAEPRNPADDVPPHY
jgi:SlyX protein